MNSNAAFGQAEADRVLEYAKLYVAEAGYSWAQGIELATSLRVWILS